MCLVSSSFLHFWVVRCGCQIKNRRHIYSNIDWCVFHDESSRQMGLEAIDNELKRSSAIPSLKKTSFQVHRSSSSFYHLSCSSPFCIVPTCIQRVAKRPCLTTTVGFSSDTRQLDKKCHFIFSFQSTVKQKKQRQE